MSRLDYLYRKLLLTKFFTKGWGNPENIKRLFEFRKVLSCRDTCKDLVSSDYPVFIDKDEVHKECRIIEGHFLSPFTLHLPGIMPKETETARFQMVLPVVWPSSSVKPVCLHLAGTGDHYFWRRRTLMARPLLKEAGIASIILENPFYGVRKPRQQLRSSLRNVSDLFVMGGGLVLESLVLFHWCERQGYGPLGITGISMGGHMASLAATNWHKPISLIPVLSWSTASSVFTEGVMSGAIPWNLLQEQYFSDKTYEDEIASLVHSPEENFKNVAFQLGLRFARDYPTSLSDMKKLQKHYNAAARDNSDVKSPINAFSKTSNVSTTTNPNSASYHTVSSSSQSSAADRAQSNDNSRSAIFSRAYLSSTSSQNARLPDWLPRVGRASSLPCDSVLHFMRGVMDECTHIGNFSQPVDTSLIIVIAAKSDAYVPRDSVKSVEDFWPGAEVRYIDSGHISAYLFKQNVFRKAIIDAFDKQIKKYYVK